MAVRRPLVRVLGKTQQMAAGDTFAKSTVGLALVDNTADADKPVSTPQAQALSGKEPTIAAGTAAQFWRGDKTWTDFSSTARAVTLTGFTLAYTQVLAADNVLSALGKTQGQINNLVSGKLDAAAVGVAAGVAPLGADAKVPAAYLPSYVDDVLEYASQASLPATGETGKIYITTDTNSQYRWTGSVYTQITQSPGTTDNVPEGAINKYFTEARALASKLANFSVTSSADLALTDTVLQALAKLQGKFNALTTNAVTEGSNLYFTVARVRATVLAGLDLASSAAITAADSVLTALGKLQAQVSKKANSADLGSMAYASYANAPFVNLMADSGRFAGKINPMQLQMTNETFAIPVWFTAYNGSTMADGGRFYHDNTTNGGANPAINADVQALLTKMGRTTTSARYGTEFRLANVTAGQGTDVAVGYADGVVRYLVFVNSAQAMFASNGMGTFAGWVRAKTGSLSIAYASFYLNGVLVDAGTPITPAMGWVHVRKVAQSTIGYDTTFPGFVATQGATIQLALCAFFSGNVDTGVHTSPLPTFNGITS